jgi:hypothetical protein
MKRVLLGLSLLLLVGATVLIVVTARAPDALQAPDPFLPITFVDGSELPLSTVLERAARGEPLPSALAPTAPVPELAADVREAPEAGMSDGTAERAGHGLPSRSPAEQAALRAEQRDLAVACWGPVFVLAREALQSGRVEQAQALFQSLPEDHPSYAAAQRAIAWDIMTRERGQPSRGIAYVQKALRAEPLQGNSWQDAARVYGSVLGFTMR